MLEINLKQLESFVATVEHSGFTAAAAALYLTQSTVSAHVSALEQIIGLGDDDDAGEDGDDDEAEDDYTFDPELDDEE